MKPIYRIQSYGILVSYSCVITMSEYKNFWLPPPLPLFTSNKKQTLFNPLFTRTAKIGSDCAKLY
jgi:hypothetical protein